MLGRGVPPPSNTFRWCTERIKIKPMLDAIEGIYVETGQKFLQLTGVRLGESGYVRTAHEAVAWTFGYDAGEYAPEVEV